MRRYSFTLLLTGDDPLKPKHLTALRRRGCHDALFGSRGGCHFAQFDRVAPTFAAAVGGAIGSIESAADSIRVARVEPDDLITASMIAERTGRTRESIRLLVNGNRGPGDFPSPVGWID